MSQADPSSAAHTSIQAGGACLRAQAAHPILWDLRYDNPDPKLHALYTKAVNEQWLTDRLDWNYTIDPARELIDPARNTLIEPSILRLLGKSQQEQLVALTVSDTLSQALHGEQAGLIIASTLAQSLPNLEAKKFAATQAMDEARHLEVFSRYIQRVSEVSRPSTSLRRVLEKILGARQWQAQLVGAQIMVESLALAIFSSLRQVTGCDLLREMLRLIMRDEARHVAFGQNYLKAGLAAMHPDDRAEIEDFAADLVREFRHWGRDRDDLAHAFEMLIKVGIDPADYLARLKADFLEKGSADLTPKMLFGLDALILPGLERVGLITDRVRPLYLASELKTSRDMRTLEEIERSLVS